MFDNNIQQSKMQPQTIDTVQITDLISLYNPITCTRCNSLIHLTPSERKIYRAETGNDLLEGQDMICHYSNGNTLCPASAMRIATYVDIDKVVNLYLAAFNAGDIKKIQKILTRIQGKGKDMEMLIMQRIKDVMQAQVSATLSAEVVAADVQDPDSDTNNILIDAIKEFDMGTKENETEIKT